MPVQDPPGPHPENQRKRRELRGPRRALIGLLAASAAIAVLGGLGLIAMPHGKLLGQSLELRFATPLTAVRGTGVVLVVVIGVTQALAALLLLQHHVHARAAALIAALIVVAWSLLQMMLLNGATWFQLALFGVGALEAFLVAGCTPRGSTRNKQLRRR